MNAERKEKPVNKDLKVISEVDISPEDLKRNVLHMVTDSKYEEAIDELQRFSILKSEYPNYKKKTERLVRHGIDLIHAIRSKKTFPGYNLLTRAKQQEIGEKILDHFSELQDTLSKINLVLLQLKKEDLRSTLWVFRAVVYSTWFLLIVALIIEVTGGLYRVGYLVFEDIANKALDWVFSLIP